METLKSVMKSLKLSPKENSIALLAAIAKSLAATAKKSYEEEIAYRQSLSERPSFVVSEETKQEAIALCKEYIEILKAQKAYAWAEYVNSNESLIMAISQDKISEESLAYLIESKKFFISRLSS